MTAARPLNRTGTQRAIRSEVDRRELNVRARLDLKSVTTLHRHESAVVVKDPVAMKYHRLRPDEFFVLSSLQPGVTLNSLCEAYRRRYPASPVSPAEINELLFRFHRLGLTVSDGEDQGRQLLRVHRQDRRRRWSESISNLLFIRFPGVDPEPLLRRLYPLVRPMFSLFGAGVAAALILAAVLALIANWQRLIAEIPAMQQWLQWRNVVILGAAIGVAKILHELGHALVCKHFGGECHQIGAMLLVFAPALYCDTSDSWMLPNRFARAAVGLAGIAAEGLLASLATLVWASSGDSLPHDLALHVMMVCGISTVLFNANPLLRYDGYYVLSDLCDVPNLAQRSRRLLSQWCGWAFLGIPPQPSESPGRQQWGLVGYAVASLLYRWALTLLILWFVLLMLRPYRLESIGRLICLVAVGGLVGAAVRGPIRFLRHPARRREIRMGSLLRTSVLIAALVVAACYPFPAGESATGRLIPRDETPIFLTTGGHLDHLLAAEGQHVATGQEIARLSNPDVQLEFLRAEARVAAQKERVDALRDSQSDLPEVANELPAAEALLAELKRQLETRRDRKAALVIRAPATGRLIAGPTRKVDGHPETNLSLARWSGDPAAAENRGCFLKAGTELFSVVTGEHWDAELILTATQVQRIAVGNAVKLTLESDPTRVFRGTVSEISLQRWSDEATSARRGDREALQQSRPQAAAYAVQVRLFETDPTAFSGAEVVGRISAEPSSLAGSLWRMASRLLRFR
jgi:putative peptide zinc metalloprotease protein